jgi:hypothetical protein
MTTTVIVPGVACALLAVLAAAGPAVADEPRPLKVTVARDRVSVEAAEVSLGEVLEAVGKAAGVAVVLDAALPADAAGRPVSVAFEEVSIDDAFRRLLRDYHAVYFYAASAAALQSVTVYGPAVAARSGLTAPPARADEPGPQRGPAAAAGANSERQAEALRSLAEKDEPAARDAALEVLARGTQAEVLEQALEVLDSLDSVPAEPLLAFAGSARPAALRGQALRLLARHWPRDPRVAALVRAGTRDADEHMRELASALLEVLQD